MCDPDRRKETEGKAGRTVARREDDSMEPKDSFLFCPRRSFTRIYTFLHVVMSEVRYEVYRRNIFREKDIAHSPRQKHIVRKYLLFCLWSTQICEKNNYSGQEQKPTGNHRYMTHM